MGEPETIERWKGQVKGRRLYSSYQDAVGIDGEGIEFEWTVFPRFSPLSILEKIQEDLEMRRIQPKEFTDQTIFMSMFNVIVWNTNDENCVSNAERVKNYAKRFLAGQWRFLGPGSEGKWFGSSNHAQKRAMDLHRQQNVQQFKETGRPVFKGVGALSRGVPKQKKGKTSIESWSPKAGVCCRSNGTSHNSWPGPALLVGFPKESRTGQSG